MGSAGSTGQSLYPSASISYALIDVSFLDTPIKELISDQLVVAMATEDHTVSNVLDILRLYQLYFHTTGLNDGWFSNWKVHSLPVYSKEKTAIVGMVDVLDLVHLFSHDLQCYGKSIATLHQFLETPVTAVINFSQCDPLTILSGEESLKATLSIMNSSELKRVLVTTRHDNPSADVHVLSQSMILRFLAEQSHNIQPLESWWKRSSAHTTLSCKELKAEHMAVPATEWIYGDSSTPIYDLFRYMRKANVRLMPLLSQPNEYGDRVLVATLSATDVVHLMKAKDVSMLQMTAAEYVQELCSPENKFIEVSPKASFNTVVQTMVDRHVHHVYVGLKASADSNTESCEPTFFVTRHSGIVSATDIFLRLFRYLQSKTFLKL